MSASDHPTPPGGLPACCCACGTAQIASNWRTWLVLVCVQPPTAICRACTRAANAGWVRFAVDAMKHMPDAEAKQFWRGDEGEAEPPPQGGAA